MVCFTRYGFTITRQDASTWFPLLSKYYYEIGCTVKTKKGTYKAPLSLEFLNGLLEKDDSDKFNIKTESVCESLVTVRVLPKIDEFERLEHKQTELSQEMEKVVNSIRSLLIKRQKLGEHEVAICPRVFDTPILQEEFVNILHHVSLREHNVTRIYMFDGKSAVVVMDESYAFYITLMSASEVDLCTFDIEDGFTDGVFTHAIERWVNSFKVWKQKLIESANATWDAPILSLEVNG